MPHKQLQRFKPPRRRSSLLKRSTYFSLLSSLALAALAVVVTGCPSKDDAAVEEDARDAMPPGTVLRVLVVDDPGMADRIHRLSAEWEAATGGTINVEAVSQKDFTKRESLGADAVICSPHDVGILDAKKWIQPLPDMTMADSRQEWDQYMKVLRNREADWGGSLYGVPFGSPTFVLYYRADILEAASVKPPRTWAEYHSAAQAIHEKGVADHPTLEPLAENWAALTLLARASSLASHPENYSVLFKIDTMEPLIAGEPFVRALEEMVATQGLKAEIVATEAGDVAPLTPDRVRELFWQGETAMAVTWPNAVAWKAGETTEAAAVAAAESADVRIAPLPGAIEAFNVSTMAWDPRDEAGSPTVPLLSMEGRMGFISVDTKWHNPTFDLLLWLSGNEWGTHVAQASPSATIFRKQQLARPSGWCESPMDSHAAKDYAQALELVQSENQCVFALRIPGRERYLESLSQAVRSAIAGEKTPTEALNGAAGEWREITEELGLQQQKDAYQKSVGAW